MIPRFLLLTDIPPNKQMTGGLYLNDIVRLLPIGSLAVFATLHPFLGKYELSPDLGNVQIKTVNALYGRSTVRTIQRRLGSIAGTTSSFVLEQYIDRVYLSRLVDETVTYGREVNAQAVITVLQSPLMWRLAYRVADALAVPLYSSIVDPPDWWLDLNLFDAHSRWRVLKELTNCLRKSTAVGGVSWNMAQAYGDQYGVRAEAIFPSLPAPIARPPAEHPVDRDNFTLGLAGQIYAGAEWHLLLEALHSVDWRIAGREVFIRILGKVDGMSTGHLPQKPVNIEFLGWRTQSEVIDLLADADACYCPYRFGDDHRTEARLAFPSKLTSYLASGRPVFFHGPDYASPAQFLEKFDAGLRCYSQDHQDILNGLETLITDADRYAQIAENGHRAFHQHLTTASQRQSVAKFLDVPVDELRRPEEFV